MSFTARGRRDKVLLLLLEAALDDQLVAAVERAHRSQLGEEEGEQVLRLTMQPEREKTVKSIHDSLRIEDKYFA